MFIIVDIEETMLKSKTYTKTCTKTRILEKSENFGECWRMLEIVGECWRMLEIVGECLSMLDNVEHC